jgi:hypothetical protein
MLLEKTSTNLTLLAFQLIEDADKSPQENKDTKLAFEERVKDLIHEVKGAGLLYEKTSEDFHDCIILELRIALPVGQDEFLTPKELSLLTLGGKLEQLNPNIGQTLVFWTKLEESCPVDLNLAQDFLRYLHLCEPGDSLYLSEGKLFGSTIYEYQGFGEDASFKHTWLWFESHPQTRDLVQKRLHELKKLLCYRSKILKSSQQAQASSKKADSLYPHIKGLSQGVKERIDLQSADPSQVVPLKKRLAELDFLKTSLKDISIAGFKLSEEIRYLRYNYRTIDINAFNYQTELVLIKKDILPRDSLNFLYEFYLRSQKQFLKQISGDLSYIIPSYDLANQTIAVIRGYLEIEQTRCERELQTLTENENEREADRDKKLQDTVESIGVALSATAIIASYSGQLEKPWRWPWSSDSSSYPHPFINHVVVSILLVWMLYLIFFICRAIVNSFNVYTFN